MATSPAIKSVTLRPPDPPGRDGNPTMDIGYAGDDKHQSICFFKQRGNHQETHFGPTGGVFAEEQRASWQAYALLAYLVEKQQHALRKLAWEGELDALRGWEDVSSASVAKNRLKQITGNSTVVESRAMSASIKPGVFKLGVNDAERAAILDWIRKGAPGDIDPDDPEARLTALLERAPSFARRLAARLSAAAGIDPKDLTRSRELAQALLRGTSADILVSAVFDVSRLRTEFANALEVLWRALPYATDWRPLRDDVSTAFSGATRAVALPLHTETIAEMVVASGDNRPCRFVRTEGDPTGAYRIAMPLSVLKAPFLPGDGTSAVDAAMYNHCATDATPEGAFRACLLERPDLESRRAALRRMFENRASPDWPPERQPYYLLISDAKLVTAAGIAKEQLHASWRSRGKKRLDTFWKAVSAACARDLGLRCVRINGGLDALDQEIGLADKIGHALFLAEPQRENR